jgi:hypothetical protein
MGASWQEINQSEQNIELMSLQSYFFKRNRVEILMFESNKIYFPKTPLNTACTRHVGLCFRRAHFNGMAFVVEKDERRDPIHVGLFGAVGIVFGADGVAHLIEKFLPLRRDGRHISARYTNRNGPSFLNKPVQSSKPGSI